MSVLVSLAAAVWVEPILLRETRSLFSNARPQYRRALTMAWTTLIPVLSSLGLVSGELANLCLAP